MARLTLTAPHKLGKHEALLRLHEKLGSSEYRRQVSDLHEEWKDDTFSFSFKAVGTKVAGTLTVSESDVRVSAVVPFAAMLFKNTITKRVSAELGAVLG
jgi:hypothetical protein